LSAVYGIDIELAQHLVSFDTSNCLGSKQRLSLLVHKISNAVFLQVACSCGLIILKHRWNHYHP
jgi:hypothetical protein